MNPRRKNLLAGIEYSGVPGASHECQDAVMRLLQFGDSIVRARILSHSENGHCLLLTINVGDLVAIKSGFASEYLGEGSRRFSYVLQLLEAHGAEIEEYEVEDALIERLDNSALTTSDIKKIDATHPVRPTRWHDYILEKHWEHRRDGSLWEEFPYIIPYAIIDDRIMDLALSFWEDPDGRLLKGYKRLEDIVRKRTGIDEQGVKLFSQAFYPSSSRLRWEDIDSREQSGRANLFIGAYQAHRNPRAHQELENCLNEQLTEFLLLNHLYLLEKSSRN